MIERRTQVGTAFSLLELMIVVAILAIMGLMTTPNPAY